MHTHTRTDTDTQTHRHTYGAEAWALTTHAKNKLAAAQTKMERSMLIVI